MFLAARREEKPHGFVFVVASDERQAVRSVEIIMPCELLRGSKFEAPTGKASVSNLGEVHNECVTYT